MFLVEKETGCKITPDYPVAKFLVQLEMINKFYKEQAKAYKKGGLKATFR